jgi:hypothetical protein
MQQLLVLQETYFPQSYAINGVSGLSGSNGSCSYQAGPQGPTGSVGFGGSIGGTSIAYPSGSGYGN